MAFWAASAFLAISASIKTSLGLYLWHQSSWATRGKPVALGGLYRQNRALPDPAQNWQNLQAFDGIWLWSALAGMVRHLV